MTREEAIRIIKIVLAIAEDFEIIVQGEAFTKEKCKEAVEIATEALSSSEKPNKWIPVSERLPEKNMACLVAVGKFNLTQMAMYSDLMGTTDHRIFYQGDYGYDSFEDITEYVKAWMPLPLPYKASPTGAEDD